MSGAVDEFRQSGDDIPRDIKLATNEIAVGYDKKYCPKHKNEQLFRAEIRKIDTDKFMGFVWKCNKCGRKKSYTFGEEQDYKHE